MTLNELKETITESPNYKWFQNYEQDLSYPHINFNVTFKGVVSLYEFVLKQVEGFNNLPQLPQELNEVKNSFIDAGDRIMNLVLNNNTSGSQWDQNLRVISNNHPLIFLYDSPETEFLIRVKQ